MQFKDFKVINKLYQQVAILRGCIERTIRYVKSIIAVHTVVVIKLKLLLLVATKVFVLPCCYFLQCPWNFPMIDDLMQTACPESCNLLSL